MGCGIGGEVRVCCSVAEVPTGGTDCIGGDVRVPGATGTPTTRGKAGNEDTGSGVDTDTPDEAAVAGGWVDTAVMGGTVLGTLIWGAIPAVTTASSECGTPGCKLLGTAADVGGNPDNAAEKDPARLVSEVGKGGPVWLKIGGAVLGPSAIWACLISAKALCRLTEEAE